ncbi:MAG: hypothetical protein LLF96_11260 [Eubacteriales bacterium]|nr:hypothetical protein [Eubacteriales bacterium]
MQSKTRETANAALPIPMQLLVLCSVRDFLPQQKERVKELIASVEQWDEVLLLAKKTACIPWHIITCACWAIRRPPPRL